MASLLTRHKTGCAIGAGKQTAAGDRRCTCKPSYIGVLGLGAKQRVRLTATNKRDAERELY